MIKLTIGQVKKDADLVAVVNQMRKVFRAKLYSNTRWTRESKKITILPSLMVTQHRLGKTVDLGLYGRSYEIGLGFLHWTVGIRIFEDLIKKRHPS